MNGGVLIEELEVMKQLQFVLMSREKLLQNRSINKCRKDSL